MIMRHRGVGAKGGFMPSGFSLLFANLDMVLAFGFVGQNTFYVVRWWYRRRLARLGAR